MKLLFIVGLSSVLLWSCTPTQTGSTTGNGEIWTDRPEPLVYKASNSEVQLGGIAKWEKKDPDARLGPRHVLIKFDAFYDCLFKTTDEQNRCFNAGDPIKIKIDKKKFLEDCTEEVWRQIWLGNSDLPPDHDRYKRGIVTRMSISRSTNTNCTNRDQVYDDVRGPNSPPRIIIVGAMQKIIEPEDGASFSATDNVNLIGVAQDEEGEPFPPKELEWLLKSNATEGAGQVVATGSIGSFVPREYGLDPSQDSLYTLIFSNENQAMADSVTIKITANQ